MFSEQKYPACMFFKITGWNMLTLWLAIYECHVKNHVKKFARMFFASPKSSKTAQTCNVFLVWSNTTSRMQNAKLTCLNVCFQNCTRKMQEHYNCFTCTWKSNFEPCKNAFRSFVLETSIYNLKKMQECIVPDLLTSNWLVFAELGTVPVLCEVSTKRIHVFELNHSSNPQEGLDQIVHHAFVVTSMFYRNWARAYRNRFYKMAWQKQNYSATWLRIPRPCIDKQLCGFVVGR